MNIIESVEVAESVSPDIIDGARAWLMELIQSPGDEIEEWIACATPAQIVARVDRLWEGGWGDFISTF